jgi:hypothetical protein
VRSVTGSLVVGSTVPKLWSQEVRPFSMRAMERPGMSACGMSVGMSRVSEAAAFEGCCENAKMLSARPAAKARARDGRGMWSPGWMLEGYRPSTWARRLC